MLVVPFSMMGTGAFMVRRAVKHGRCRKCKRSENGCTERPNEVRDRSVALTARPLDLRRRPALVLAARSSTMSRDSLGDRGLPVVAEAGVVGRALVGECDSPRVIDQCAQAILVERRRDVRARAALDAVAGHEKEDAGKRLAQFGQLLRIGCTDDRAHQAVARFTPLRTGPSLETIGDMPIKRPSIDDQVLKLARRSVAGTNQDEDAFLFPRGDLDERRDPVAAQVRIDGDGVDLPRRFESASDGDFPQVAARVRLGRRADVVSLAVEDDDQVFFTGISNRRMECRETRPVRRLRRTRTET